MSRESDADRAGARATDDESRQARALLSVLEDLESEKQRLAAEVSERRRLESELRVVNKELEQRYAARTAELEIARDAALAANRAKSEFLANMSHEIRTPLNAVLGLTEIVLQSELNDQQRERLSTVLGAGESLLGLIDDLLDFSKIEAGMLRLERVSFNLHDLVSDTLHALAIRAERHGLELACRIAPELPVDLAGDAGRLRQVLTNLVNNAIKFTERGEVVVRIEGERRGDLADLEVSVCDTGVGIEPERLASVFAPFEQVDTSTTRRFGGVGLGLSISRQLVELMGGQLGAESTLGVGSTFRFNVRLSVVEAAGGRPRAMPAPIAGSRVLIVDDNETNRQILEEITRAKGMRSSLATSADEAFAFLEQGLSEGDPVRILLSDLRMPDVDGFGLVERIRADSRLDDLEVILLTSSGQTGDLERCEQLRIAARLFKPVHQSELFEVMARVLGANEAPPARPGVSPEVSLPPLRILLVEDSLANQTVARAMLEGHEVCVAANGARAIERLAEETFDVALMDVQMPVMDGLQATRAIRAAEAGTGRRLPVIAMTAHALREDRMACLAAGMDGYVAKPVGRRALLQTIAHVLEGQGHEAMSGDPRPT